MKLSRPLGWNWDAVFLWSVYAPDEMIPQDKNTAQNDCIKYCLRHYRRHQTSSKQSIETPYYRAEQPALGRHRSKSVERKIL